MSTNVPHTALQLRSLVTPGQQLELFLDTVEVPSPGPDQVLVRVEAAPINPSDLGLLLAGADLSGAVAAGTAERPVVTAPLPDAAMRAMTGRVGVPMAVGNEGAGTVVATGTTAVAQALLGKTVAVAGGPMYSQYRCVDASLCLELPQGTTAAEGASAFVNPLTALGMVETMRLDQHVAIVHTAAASNLGQMLNRLCLEEDVPLVNIVRKPEQEELLRAAGAEHVCNSASPSFMNDLTQAIKATSATLAFDAIGGGKLASQILTCMEAAASATESGYSRYGSTAHKQLYIYGGLDRGPTILTRNFGMAWGIGGWLLTPFLQRIGSNDTDRLRRRVASNLKTTFASNYTDSVSLAGALQLDAITAYAQQATGSKYLITPATTSVDG
jgi:NADPH:quinone reductase-like Zn-dependent oxidoreductase